MDNNTKKINKRYFIIIAIGLLLIAAAIAVYVNLPKPQTVNDSSFDLTKLENASYEGECDNGMVYAKVSVEVKDHSIKNITILEHKTGKGEPAETITDAVMQKQSIEVDAISGATLSSQTILKAIENALSQTK